MAQYKTFDVNSFVTNIKTTYFEFIAIYYHTQTYKLLPSCNQDNTNLIKSMYYLYTFKIFYYYFASAVLSLSAFVIFLFSFSIFI